MAIRVLGIDPGFRSLGWAIIEYDGSLAKCVEAGVIRTQKSKHKIPVWQDNQDRCKSIGQDLRNVCTSYNIKLIAVEAESWTRTSSDRVIGMVLNRVIVIVIVLVSIKVRVVVMVLVIGLVTGFRTFSIWEDLM